MGGGRLSEFWFVCRVGLLVRTGIGGREGPLFEFLVCLPAGLESYLEGWGEWRACEGNRTPAISLGS